MPVKRKPPLAGSNRKLYVVATAGYGFDGKRRCYSSQQHNTARSSAYRARMTREAAQFKFVPNAGARVPLNSAYTGYANSYDDYMEDDQPQDDNLNEDDVYGVLRYLNFGQNHFQRPRARDITRKQLTANWSRIEPWLAAYRLGYDHKVGHCSCSSIQRREVVVISLLGMLLKLNSGVF